jgi:tetratricopeptide (TPR) repeat protein
MPEFLTGQLDAHGFAPGEASRCAQQLGEHPGPAAAASLFVDLGSCKFLEGDVDGAVASWRHAISSPHDAAASRALLNLGLLYEHLHLHDRAAQVLSAVQGRSVEPYVETASLARARCQAAVGDADAAMETVARLAHGHMQYTPDAPSFVTTLYALGDIAAEAGRMDRAERSWRLASVGTQSPIQQAAQDRLVELLAAQGRDAEVRDLLDTAGVSVDPELGRALVDRVETLYRLDEVTTAAALAEAATRHDLLTADRFRLAEAHLRNGAVNNAIDELELLLASPDTDVSARSGFELGQIYRTHGMAEAAEAMFDLVEATGHPVWIDRVTQAQSHAPVADHRSAPSAEVESAPESDPDDVDPLPLAAPVEEAEDVMPMVLAEPDVVDLDALEDQFALHDPFADGEASQIDLTEPQPLSNPTVVDLRDDLVDTDPYLTGDTAIDPPFTDDPVVESAFAAEPAPEAPSIDPMIVDLGQLEAVQLDHRVEPEPVDTQLSDVAEPSTPEVAVESPAPVVDEPVPVFQAFAESTVERNPYAALAPQALDDPDIIDTPASRTNPYAELAPDFSEAEVLPDDVEPGDWQAMLPDWPDANKPKPAPKAFSRYT